MSTNTELRRIDSDASLRTVIAAVNTLFDRDLGNRGSQTKNYGYSGARQQTVSSNGVSAGAVTSSNNYTHDLHSAVGFVLAARLAATARDVPATPANSSALIQEAGIVIGAGKALRLYNAAGTFYLSMDGTVATANRTVTFPDLAGTVALLEATQTFTGQNTFSNATAPIIAAKLGPSSTQQHTLPVVASDTLALVGAAQTLLLKTLTNPTINAAALSGTFTGAPDFSGAVTFSGLTWTDFSGVVTLEQNGVRTQTVTYAKYRVIGKTAFVRINIICTNAGTSGFSIVIASIPAAIQPAQTGDTVVCGMFSVKRSAVRYVGAAIASSSTHIEGIQDASAPGSSLGATPAFALANTDVVSCNLTYEIA